MTQQPILIASEVIELLKDALPDDETLRAAFWMVVKESYRLSSSIDDYLERNIDLCRVYAMVTAL
jgi:hypothetical protein